jgi:hypothetical protein
MKNGKDFIYEYSDLNLFRTRVQVLTGEYADTILEFGGSILKQWEDKNQFTFEYELYQIPQHLKDVKLKQDKEFQQFLAQLLVDVIAAKKQDKDEHSKLMQAASTKGAPPCKIKIDPWFYENKLKVAA